MPVKSAAREAAGSIKQWGGAAIPAGWLDCNGAAVSRTTYAALFAVISTTYGVGDGSTTFNVPDFRSRSILGAGTGSGLSARSRGQTGGAETVVLTEAQLASHFHSGAVNSGAGSTSAWTADRAAANTGSAGSNSAHSVMHPWACANYIIKT